jgi:hypothetical protein
LLGIVYATAAVRSLGFSELSNGRGATNVEAVTYTPEMGSTKSALKAFQGTIYPLLRANCSGCHSTENRTASGAQAPLHADADVNLAHEYALTRVNFRQPENSKLVVRMSIDRHNCFDTSCAAAGKKMLAAVVAWRDRVAGMIPELPRSPGRGRLDAHRFREGRERRRPAPVADAINRTLSSVAICIPDQIQDTGSRGKACRQEA